MVYAAENATIASKILCATQWKMTSSTNASPTSFSRHWLWPFIVFSTGLLATSPFALVSAAIVFFAISAGVSSFAEVAIAAGAVIAVFLWFWLAWLTTMLFFRRKSPLVVIDNKGVEIPHAHPPFIAWDQIASVEQVKFGRVSYLRLQLVSPNEHLSRWQRLIKWPYSDSVLATLGVDSSTEPDPTFVSVKARHAAHFDDQTEGLDETAMV